MSSSRRSTRTVKAPERLDATPAASKKRATKTRSSKSATASNKRRKTPKRKGAQRRHISDDEDDNDEDASEVAESESEGDLDDASDYEAEKAPAPRTPRKQTAVAKKPTAKQKPAAKQKKQTAKAIAVLASSSAEANMEITVEESLLLTTIQDDRVALTQVASDWIDSYRDDCDGALCELINFLIRLTGCPSKITEEAVYDSDEIGAVLEGLQKQCITALKQGGASSAEAADGLLMGKAKEQRKFRKNALQFVVKVIEVGQHQLVFDQVSDDNRLSTFTEVLLQWLVNMAGSSYRPFRHVATLITMAVQSALVGIRVRISAEQQTTHRQLEAEQSRQLKSRRNNRESARGEQLRARVAELTEQDELAEAAFKAFYDTVFIYRYRDVHAIIRSECLVPLASWCRAYPASYLDTEYLRYLGWSLNDRDPRVREVALLAIAGPLILAKPSTGNQGAVGSGVGALSGVDSVSEDSITEGIRPFIVRFLPRLVQIAVGDVDTRVQVAALKLLSLLGKHEYLDPTARIGDIRHVKRLGGSKGDGVGKSKRKNASKSTANKRSRGSYKNSLSQQMLEESSSESDASDENEGANPATDDVGEDDANLLHLQTLYSSNEDLEDNALPCPRHTVMMYLAPLVAHTHATVRAAAADMVAWWIKQDWVSSAHTLAFGVDSALNGSGLNLDDDSDETEPAQEADEDEDMPQATDDMSGLEGDASATITDILETPARRKRAKKWLLYKSLGAFLWRLAHADRQKPHGNGDAADADGMDAESRQLWVLEQAASRIEEIWSTPASSLGFSLSEETVAALAGSTIGDIPPTPLDAAIDGAAGANIGSVLPRPVAAAQALYHKLPELADVDTISSFLTWDHSTQVSRGGESTALSRFSLAPAEETALLQAYAVWVLERNKTINDKLKRVRNKEKADLEEELRAPSKQWQLTMVPLLVRNIDCPVRLLPLVFLATESLDPQVLFDANKTDALQDIAKNLSLVLERYGGNVRLARLVASFLERVDATKILRAADEMAEDIDGQEQPSAATAPGPLVTKAVESTAAALSTAVAAVPETRVGASLSAYADVYARIVALRSFIHTKDISALMATSSESSEAADGRADLTGRSAECAIEQIFALLASAARCLSSPTVPESTALAALDTAYYFVLWRALGFSQLLAQGAAHPYSESEPTPFWQRANAAVKLLVRDRDTLVATCLELVDVAGTNYRRLREMAFTVLGNTVKLFTGSLARRPAEPAVESAAVRHMALLRRTLALPNSVSVQQRLIQFFGHKVSAWSALLLSLSGHEPKLSGDLAITAPWYQAAPSSWSTAYARFCGQAADWAQWLGARIVPASQLSLLAAHTGMLGLEPLEKKQLSAADNEQQKQHKPRRIAGFVTLSAYDHIVQAAVDALKPLLAMHATRESVMAAYEAAMRASHQVNVVVAKSPMSDAVNVATLARFIGAALKTVVPTAARNVSPEAPTFVLAPVVIGTEWVAHHKRAIDFGLSLAIPEDAEPEVDDAEPVLRAPVSRETWETKVAPLFVALSQTVAGILRPRHAETLNQHLSALQQKYRLSAGTEDSAEDSEYAIGAIAPYQKALDRELAKLSAVNARMAEVRAATEPVLEMPVSGGMDVDE